MSLVAHVDSSAKAAQGLLAIQHAALLPDRNHRRKAQRLGATRLLKVLEAYATLQITSTLEFSEGDLQAEKEGRQAVQALRLDLLERVREADAVLSNYESEVVRLRRAWPELAERLSFALPEALRRTREARAFLSFMAGEDDHREMGREFVPRPKKPGSYVQRGSTSFKDAQ